MRVFFAFWPDDATRAAAAAAAELLLAGQRVRRVPPANYHLTLCFIGEVDDARLPGLIVAGEGLSVAPFEIALDESGRFRRAAVAWLGPSTVPPEAVSLHAALHARVNAAGFPVGERPFHPHLTIARACRRRLPEYDGQPVRWPVDEFVLCASRQAATGRVNYEIMHIFGGARHDG